MLKLWLLKRYVRRLLGEGGRVALWLSGGKDSRLLLEVMLETGLPFSVLRFDEGWSREQRKVVDELIMRHNLGVYSYPASWGSLVGNTKGEIALIRGYAVGSNGETSALIRDVVETPYAPGRCIEEIPMENARRVAPPVQFDLHLVGTKKGEGHWSLAGGVFLATRRWEVGDVDFAAPLFGWSDRDVVRALTRYGIPYWHEPADTQDTGNVASCTRCLHPGNAAVHCPKRGEYIKPLDWSPTANLASFQADFGGK